MLTETQNLSFYSHLSTYCRNLRILPKKVSFSADSSAESRGGFWMGFFWDPKSHIRNPGIFEIFSQKALKNFSFLDVFFHFWKFLHFWNFLGFPAKPRILQSNGIFCGNPTKKPPLAESEFSNFDNSSTKLFRQDTPSRASIFAML